MLIMNFKDMNRVFASPGWYVQSSGVLCDVGDLTTRHGNSALVVADDVVWELTADSVQSSFESVSCGVTRAQFQGECTVEEIDRLTGIATDADIDVVVGMGGGKAIDAAKSVSSRLDLPLGSVPTIASTDAPTSSLSVLYGEDGALEDAELHRRHPDFVLVDTALIAQAPTRWFVSGIGDALATWYEAKTTWESGGTTVFDARPTHAGRALARSCYQLLRDHAVSAVRAVEVNSVTESVEAVTEATVLLSGIGFENGGLAAAHAVHDGLTTLPAAGNATHGEKVMIGLLTKLVLQGADDETILDLVDFADTVGLPTNLTDIGITDPNYDELLQVGRVAADPDGPISNETVNPTPERIAAALRTVDSLSTTDS